MAAEIVVRVPRNTLKVLLMGLAILASTKDTSSTEQVQLTTYYPAPSGVYQQMMTTENAYLSTGSGVTDVGTTGNNGYKFFVNGTAGTNNSLTAQGPIWDKSGCFKGSGGTCIASPSNGAGGWHPYAVYQ